jgi:flagellar protein FlgJ
MNIDSTIEMSRSQISDAKRDEIKKEQAATDFEKIFARQLVKELTQDSFKMTDNMSGVGHSGSLYRDMITDTLARELAAQRKLGMADLIIKHWNQGPDSANDNS